MTPAQAMERLGYEWWMLRATSELLSKLPKSSHGDPVRNALVESFAVHGRALVDFFYKEPQRTDDLHVGLLGIGLARGRDTPPTLQAWITQTSKRIVHMTTQAADHEWWYAIVSVLRERIDEVRRLAGEKMPPYWTGDRPTGSALLRGPDPG